MTEKLGPFELGKVHCVDCLEAMKELPDGCVDAVVTDPPYGIGFKYNTHEDKTSEYPSMMRTVVTECRRICEGPHFWFQGMPHAPHWHDWFPDEFRIMAACKTFVQMRRGHIQWAFDPVIFWEGEGPVNDRMRDWLVSGPEFQKEDIPHPCPRPLAHMLRIVSTVTGLVLDPFAGSGTTGVACVKTGRRFIGFEIDPEYCRIANKRIEAARKGVTLKEHRTGQASLWGEAQ